MERKMSTEMVDVLWRRRRESSSSDGHHHDSPFSTPVLRRLFVFYGAVGVIPGRLSADHCSFLVRWWRHGFVIVVFAALVTCQVISQSMISELYTDSSTDDVVADLAGYMGTCTLALFMWANHVGFSQCYRVNARLAQSSSEFPSAFCVLKHHIILMALYSANVVLESAGLFSYKDNARVHPGIICGQLVVSLVFNCYFFAVQLAAEVAIERLLQCLGSMLSRALDDLNSKRVDVKEFCDRADVVRQCYGDMGKIFGNSLLILILTSLMRMIWRCYFLISHYFGNGGGVDLISFLSLQHALMIAISLKIIAHITGSVHAFKKKVDDVLEKIIDLEASATDQKDRSQAVRMYKLLVISARDGLSVRGFFIVDRIVFPELIGFFLTYLVLLIEFRAGEESKKTDDAVNVIPSNPQTVVNGTGVFNDLMSALT